MVKILKKKDLIFFLVGQLYDLYVNKESLNVGQKLATRLELYLINHVGLKLCSIGPGFKYKTGSVNVLG